MKLSVILSAVIAISAARSERQVEAAHSYGYQGPPAPLAEDGTVLDTPEVAQAKAAHLAAHAAALARASHGHQYDHGQQYDQRQYAGYNNEDIHGAYNGAHYNSKPRGHAQAYYQGPAAPLAHDGRVMDTPEVAQARAAHLAAHAHALARTNQLHYGAYEDDVPYRSQGYAVPVQVSYAHTSPAAYQGPFAPLGHDGRVIDTPEVAEAKAAHLKAYANAVALATHLGHAPSEVEKHAPPEVHRHAPAEIQRHSPAEVQRHVPAEVQVHEPSSEGEQSYEEVYY